MSFAISLLLGVGVRFFAPVAVAFSLHLRLGSARIGMAVELRLPGMLHARFVAYAAGRSLGADALLRRRADENSLVGRFVGLAG
jgi:hypothetical protein